MSIVRMAFIALSISGPAYACGYSDDEHALIWSARLDAARYAELEAAKKCGWTPEEQITFADDIRPEEGIRKPEAFLMISTMIRKDQNVLALYNSFRDPVVRERAAVALRQINASNLISMKRYFEQNDFPGIADVGNNGVNALLLLVAHADTDPAFQSDVLEMMRKQVEKGNLPPYIPSVLEAIRPQVSARGGAPDQAGPNSKPAGSFESPRRCFRTTRSRLISSHLQDNFGFSTE